MDNPTVMEVFADSINKSQLDNGDYPFHRVETNHAIMEGHYGDTIGEGTIKLPEKGFYISGVTLKDGVEKGKGHGQEIYKKALLQHNTLYSTHPITEDAINAQEALERKGLMTIDNQEISGIPFRVLKPTNKLKEAPLQKAQLDMFGGEAPEVPKVPANPSEDRMSNLSVDHKQIYNTLTKKQNSNSITSPEKTHLQKFNQYLKGDISHEQLKGYIAYKQNEHHTPLFQNAPEVPKVEAPVPEPQPTDNEQGKVVYRGQQINQVKRNPNQAGTWYAEDKKLAQHFADHVVGNKKPNGEVIEHRIDGKIFHFPHLASDYAKISDKLGEIFGTTQQKIREALGINHQKEEIYRIHSLLENKGIHKILKDQGYSYVKAKEKLNSKGDSTPTYLKLDDEHQPTVDNVQAPPEVPKVESPAPEASPTNVEKKKTSFGEDWYKWNNNHHPDNPNFQQKVNWQLFHKPTGEYSVGYKLGASGNMKWVDRGNGDESKVKSVIEKYNPKNSTPDITDEEYEKWKAAKLKKTQVDNVQAPTEMLSEKEFNKKYKAQHKDIRSKTEDEKLSVKQKILNEGFNQSMNVNALPIFKKPDNVISKTYGNKKGDIVYLLPKDGVEDKMNGYQVKKGHKPSPSDIIRVEYDHQPTYEAYKNQILDKTNPKVIPETKQAEQPKNELLESIYKDEQGTYEHKGWKDKLYASTNLDHLREIKQKLESGDKKLQDRLYGENGKDFYLRLNYLERHAGNLKKSQTNMFGEEPKVDDIQVKPSENFIKPEHELTSDNGTWKLKGDPTATAKMHKWLKDKYNKKEIYTYGGLLQSGHPLVDKIKELHGDDKEPIFDHYNKITGRESGKPAGVGETQLRMSMKDGGGLPIGDKHFQVPDLSKEAKIERDSYPNGIALHQALNNGDVSPELHKWHKDYKFNSHHTDKSTISTENPEGKKYERTLYDKDAGNFGNVKQTKEDNLSPEDLEKYQALKEKYGEEPEFDYTHYDRLNELKEKANKTYPLSDKFSPEDKEIYNRLQEDKERFTRALQEKGITAKQREANQEVLDDLTHQESELHNDYREKLGLHKGDLTGEKGFSYKQELEPEEKAEYEDLKNRKQFSKLHQQYNQPPEEHHISKLLKYPMSSNQKTFDDDHMEEPEENANLFDQNQVQPEPEVPEKMDVSEKVNAPKQKTKKAKVPQISIEDHFPTVGIRTPGSLQKVGKEYGHRPEDSTKEYKPTSMVDFNGAKYQIQSDGGTYVLAKNLGTGKVDTIAKNDLENYPTDKKVPIVYKQDVEKFMHEQGDKEMPLEEIYSGMKFPDDIKGKEHIKKKIKMALLQLEHNYDPEEGHTPIVNRSIGTPHPKETDPREKGIMYRLAKSMKEFATQNRIYIKSRNLIKSLMIELYPKEKSIYEKSIESLDILHSLAEWKDQEKSLSAWLDNIQAASIKKSATNLLDISCSCLDGTTNRLSTIQSRFELLKSMDDGSFQRFIDEAVALDEEEEQRTTYRLSKSYMESEAYKNKQIEYGNE